MSNTAEPATLVHLLVDAAARDLLTYRRCDDNPNARAAGQAALTSINAAIRALEEVRMTLTNDLHGSWQLRTKISA